MKLRKDGAEIYVWDGVAEEEAIARTTLMGVGAHQDDLEIMAYHGILECFGNPNEWFAGVTVTNGSGSPRDDLYADYSDDEMQIVRRMEQKKAAHLGEYGVQFLLDYPSSEVKDPGNPAPREDLRDILEAARPRVVYTHNFADKHDTHVAVASRVIEAIREMDADARPEQVLGCEVWRDLDWMIDEDKVALDVAGHESLAMALLGVFDSQDCGGKRYDLATMGRRRAHATYHATHDVDVTDGLTFAMDLTPLIEDESLDIRRHVQEHITRFAEEVAERLDRVCGG
ncbi:MAG: PIG-L family deacetylase [Armatimonadetes bacterium]|nr:PIG-L family deacetylase [Armatimonadota bacterium]